jgi:hypothetical protein
MELYGEVDFLFFLNSQFVAEFIVIERCNDVVGGGGLVIS